MARWTPLKKDVLEALADEVLHNYGHGRTIVAVDGVDGSGKGEFAADLATALERKGHSVFRASMDSFHRPRSERYLRGEDSSEGFYRDAYDYSVLRRVLIDPFKIAGSTAFVTAAFDYKRDAPIQPKWLTGPADAILIIDGEFLNRPELRGLWNYSIWIDVPQAQVLAKFAARDGVDLETVEEINRRYLGAQALYQADANPRGVASAIMDNTDPEHPRRVFADSC